MIAGSLVGSDTQCSIGWRAQRGLESRDRSPRETALLVPAKSSQVLESACLGAGVRGQVWELCSLRLVPKLLLVSLTVRVRQWQYSFLLLRVPITVGPRVGCTQMCLNGILIILNQSYLRNGQEGRLALNKKDSDPPFCHPESRKRSLACGMDL